MIASLALLPIFGYATLFYIFAKRSVSVSIFFSISAIITVLFIFGMVDILKFGTYLIFYGGVALLILMGILFIDRLRNILTSVPFLMYLIVSIIYLYMIKDAHLFFWDEYSHWGAFIKEMYFFDKFYDATSVAANLMYPPGISIWDYFIVKPTGYYEGSLYFAYFLILFSSTLMMYEKLSFKKVHWIILIFFIQMVIFATFGHWFSSIYVDHIVGAMFAGLVLSFLSDKFNRKELLLFIFPLVSIVLVKEIGLFLGTVFLGFVFISYLFKSKIEKSDTNIKYILLVIIFLFLTTISILKIWEARQESKGLHKTSNSMSYLVKNILDNKEFFDKENLDTQYRNNFIDVVLYQQLHKEKVSLNYNEFSYGIMSKFKKKLKLSTIGSFLFFIFLILLTIYVQKDKNEKRKLILFGTYFVFFGFLYLIIVYFSMPLAFKTRSINMVSYVRYINTYIMPLMFIGFALFLPMFYKDGEDSKKSFWSVLVAISILTFITKPYFKPLYSQLENGFRKNADTISRNILQIVPPKSKLFVVFPIRNNGSLNIVLRYSLIPARATISGKNFGEKSSQEMLDIYKKYDYIWFSTLNKNIFDKNRNILRQKGKKGIFTLYKVEKANNSIVIKPII